MFFVRYHHNAHPVDQTLSDPIFSRRSNDSVLKLSEEAMLLNSCFQVIALLEALLKSPTNDLSSS